jgi:hypothetical protein
MKIRSAEVLGDALLLRTTHADAQAAASVIKPDTEYELKEVKRKRSRDANAYAWQLIDKIAAAMNASKIDVYRAAIRDIGGVSETVCVKQEAADKLISGWTRNGLGWQAETIPSKLPDCVNIVLYYGSSTYDTAQMCRLIENLIQDAKALNIETIPPWKVSC